MCVGSQLEKLLDGITDVHQERISKHTGARIAGVLHVGSEFWEESTIAPVEEQSVGVPAQVAKVIRDGVTDISQGRLLERTGEQMDGEPLNPTAKQDYNTLRVEKFLTTTHA